MCGAGSGSSMEATLSEREWEIVRMEAASEKYAFAPVPPYVIGHFLRICW